MDAPCAENCALFASANSHNKTPPTIVEHHVPSGHGHWNISDTPNTFYSSLDLLIIPTDNAMAVADAAATQLPISIPAEVPFAVVEDPMDGIF